MYHAAWPGKGSGFSCLLTLDIVSLSLSIYIYELINIDV